MLVRAPMLVPLRPEPDLKLPATARPEQRVTWLDTASRMPTVESAARVPDQDPPGEIVNVVAASAGAARTAAAATASAGAATRPIRCFMTCLSWTSIHCRRHPCNAADAALQRKGLPEVPGG